VLESRLKEKRRCLANLDIKTAVSRKFAPKLFLPELRGSPPVEPLKYRNLFSLPLQSNLAIRIPVFSLFSIYLNESNPFIRGLVIHSF
jgi:hypothetical protein